MQHLPPWMLQRGMLLALGALVAGIPLVVILFLARDAATSDTPPPAAADLLADFDTPPDDAQTRAGSDRPAPSIVVYVSGAVQRPDVYSLPPEARVKDLVLAAGGMSSAADAEQINLAETLRDGQHIHIPRQGATAPEGGSGPAPQGSDAGGLVNLNRASAEELDTLKGVGPTLAQRIIEHRETNGPFESVEDLREVKGIGESLYNTIAPLVTVSQ
ncbi:MAG TPA: helix-hairpin-helix domain-containing protein [Roseiflexaceae bacterium]|nr:helix-hairpin-helix domain-containing protein [Roseiflexaceae bacterium]